MSKGASRGAGQQSPSRAEVETRSSVSASDPGAAVPHPSTDIVLVHGVTADGEGVKVLRQRNDRIELGAIVPAKEGKPLTGELVQLRQRQESPLLYDVEVQYAAPQSAKDNDVLSAGAEASEADRIGPARVATEPYRKGWDRIWGAAPRRRMVN